MTTNRRLPPAAVAALGAAIAIGGCSERAPLVLDKSSAGRVISYPAETVALDPSARIGFERERTFGASATGSGPLYRPLYLALDEADNVYVLDEGNKNIVVFSASGELLRTFGREGQGPGELRRPRGIAVVEGMVFAITDHGRMAVWSPTGELLQDIRLSSTHPHIGLDAFDDGTLVVSHSVSPDTPNDVVDSYMPQIIAGYDVEGSLVREYASTPSLFRMRGVTPMGDLPTSTYAVDPAGRIYVTDGATYDIVAIDADGTKPWHLTVDLPPEPWTEADTDRIMAGLRIPGTVSEFTWPEVLPSLTFLKVDGHGHLYVYRFMRRIYDQDHRIVDVFDRDGAHLFSGTQDAIPWQAARGDLVYAFEDDEASGGQVVVAYRLVEPF